MLFVIAGLAAYAAVTMHFRVFPFYQLKAVKLHLMPEHDVNYYLRLKEFTVCKPCDYDIMMVGDSLIAHGDWRSLLPALKIANRGISGDDSEGAARRLDSMINTGATQAFIMLGINDFYEEKEVDDVLENYRKIIGELLQRNVSPIIQSTLYVSREDARLRPKITALNDQLKALADADERITFVDLNAILSRDGDLKREFTTDGLHLNQAGYMAWACYLLEKGYMAMPAQQVLPAYCRGDM